MQPLPFRLCLLLTRELCRRAPEEVLRESVAGGVDCVQLREKALESRGLYEWASRLSALCRQIGVPLVVNDNPEVARAVGARGVHVGQTDMHPEDVRRVVGPDTWVGWSTHDLEQLDEAPELGVDYVGLGPAFATATKGVTTGLGAEYLAAGVAIARVPVIAIGGITPENAWMIPEQAGLAVSSALCSVDEPAEAARAILAARA